MGKLEGKINSIGKLIGASMIAGALVLGAPTYKAYAQNKPSYSSEAVNIFSIRNNMNKRGYMTLEEFKTAVQAIKDVEFVDRDGMRVLARKTPESETAFSVLAYALKKDLVPYKAMFYLSLENKDYEGAEAIRRDWVRNLKFLHYWFSTSPITINHDYGLIEKVGSEIQKLEATGLTDPLLITLREELVAAVKEKKWDDAQKIQNIILGRTKELQQETRCDAKNSLEDKVRIVGQTNQKPTEYNLKIENIPRYGAEDIGRALLLLEGKTDKLSPKAEGTLKLIDILLKR
ncbi:MAG: hypothetical protein QXR60_01150 [Candidatus Nanoarchaeia archaeon]